MTSQSQFKQLYTIGQSVWLDNLTREMIQNGILERLVTAGEVTGITTNPSIFKAAIASGTAYAGDLARYRNEEADPERRYERLAISDVQNACDILKPVYEATGGNDGYVSLEVSPRLAYEAQGTLAAAKRLRLEVDRDNLLIKIPGTPEGAQAFEECIALGISVNVTLLFSLGQMSRIFEAYQSGLKRHAAAGGELRKAKAVASFFMSRIDTLVDKRLADIGTPQALALRGQTAVAIGKLAYAEYQKFFAEPRFTLLRERGARPQYLLWASTSVKNPSYNDLLYVEPLIGPETINTMPDATLNAFRDHGKAVSAVSQDLEQAHSAFAAVEALGIEHEATGKQLQDEGVKLFEESYSALLGAVA